MKRLICLSFPAACVVMAIGASSIIYAGHIAEAVAYANQLEAARQDSPAPVESPLPPRKP